MGAYTQSIREILQMNKTPQQKLTNVQDVYDIASQCLFDEMPENVISDDYKEQFVTGFTLHFMNDELGLETLPLWKIALNEKIYNSGTYINKIFENLDKEIFAEYNVKSVTDSGTTSGTKSFAGTVSIDKDVLSSSTDKNTRDITKKGSELRLKGGEDELEKQGSEGRVRGGDDTLEKKGSEFTRKAGQDDLEKKGSEFTKNSGKDTTEDNGYQNNINSNASSNFTNAVQINSDTPMGSLQNLRSPAGGVTGQPAPTSIPYGDEGENVEVYDDSETGRGYNFNEGKTYNYMSGAIENGQTVQNVENGNDKSLNYSKVETEHGLGTTVSYGKTASGVDARKDINEYHSLVGTTYGKKIDDQGSESNDAREDKTTYNSNDRVMYGKYKDGQGEPVSDPRKDISRYDSGESIRYGYYKDGEGVTQEDERVDTIEDDGSHSSAVMDDTTQMTSNNEMTSGSHSNNVGQIDHSLNWEMLYKSMPLLNKVWEIFDDLFMLIF